MKKPSHYRHALMARIQARSARVAVVGLGYVGLPLAIEFARAGFRVCGVDTDPQKVKAIRAGRSYIRDVASREVAAAVASGALRATADFGILRAMDALSICVPTPLSKTKDPDLSYVIASVEAVARYVRPGMLIVLESTTYPGTTDEIVIPRLLGNGLRAGRDVFVAFSPERLDPGRADFVLKNTPKVIGGATPACLAVASALYRTIVDRLVPVSSAAAAEMVKLLENTFRAVNIALANEFLMICGKLNLDGWEVIEAAATKPYGFMKFLPGPGVGGHCIPLDPQYLQWKLRTVNYNARFIQLASEINAAMPEYWVLRVAQALNQDGRSLRGRRILVLGVTYKPDVADIRESPALDIIRLLAAWGARVRFHDPFVRSLGPRWPAAAAARLTPAELAAADCVVIVTHHSSYDWEWIARHARRIVDTRNVLARKGVSGRRAPSGAPRPRHGR